ncbi:hypothetical protein CYMTET_38979 [Cymbomonas tetramitiformis]|uniref:EF-hand domain-containing protein n=1 Tax=Cymbomonas tetramitiformis TaxID=36881 RepID=A0AAE0F541_9CHLO|nr:hypothetical protein CYMTET_38979 [Cymbomonas tetramitiformis]
MSSVEQVVVHLPLDVVAGQVYQCLLPDGRHIQFIAPAGVPGGSPVQVPVQQVASPSQFEAATNLANNYNTLTLPYTPYPTPEPNVFRAENPTEANDATPLLSKSSQLTLPAYEVNALQHNDCLSEQQRTLFSAKAAKALFDKIDASGDGSLTLEEIDAGLDQPDVQELIQESDIHVLGQMLSKSNKKREQAFKKLDVTSDGRIHRFEWDIFVDRMVEERIDFLRAMALIQGLCYYGKGLDGEDYTDCCGCVSSGNIPRGWIEDYNIHKLDALDNLGNSTELDSSQHDVLYADMSMHLEPPQDHITGVRRQLCPLLRPRHFSGNLCV